MNTGKIAINSKGKYLAYNVISSHSCATNYAYTWVDDINDASLLTSTNLKKLNWKGKSPIDEIVQLVNAYVSRKVILTSSL